MSARTVIALAVAALACCLTADAAQNLPDVLSGNTTLCGYPTHPQGHLPASRFEQYQRSPPICMLLHHPMLSKIVFYPRVDEFSLLEIDGSFTNETMADGDMRFRVEVGDKFSPWARVYSRDHQFIVPYFTVTIEVDGSKVKSIQWDEGCYTCKSEACVEGRFCGVPVQREGVVGVNGTVSKTNSCRTPANPEGSHDCDLKVYVGWVGQDSRNNYLLSSGQRLSQFRSFSVAAAAESAAETFNENAPRSPEQLPDGVIPN